jgi:hypothetical protein
MHVNRAVPAHAITPERMLGEAANDRIIYRLDAVRQGHQANFRVFDPPELFAEVSTHNPDPHEKTTFFFRGYSNRTRGYRKQRALLGEVCPGAQVGNMDTPATREVPRPGRAGRVRSLTSLGTNNLTRLPLARRSRGRAGWPPQPVSVIRHPCPAEADLQVPIRFVFCVDDFWLEAKVLVGVLVGKRKSGGMRVRSRRRKALIRVFVWFLRAQRKNQVGPDQRRRNAAPADSQWRNSSSSSSSSSKRPSAMAMAS